MTSPKYAAYGLCWQSDFPLTGLPSCDRDPDVTIRSWSDNDGPLDQGADGGDHLYFRYLDLFEFRMDEGRDVRIHLLELEDSETIRAFILGTVMAVAFRQRGQVVLHASGVAKDGHAIGFVGESGWGKSTLAEFFCQKGYAFFTDDVLVVEERGGTPHVVPGYPVINLRAPTGQALRTDFDDLHPIRADGTKRMRIATSDFADAPQPLAALYVLTGPTAPEFELVPLPPHVALAQLVCHMHGKGYVRSQAYHLDQMRQTAALARQVPVRVLRRVEGLQSLPTLFEHVEADVARLTQAA